MLCHFQSHIASEQCFCLTAELQPISFKQFWSDVLAEKIAIQALPHPVWALWETQSYDFLVLLFAGLLAQKQIILPPHRVAELEQRWASEEIYFLSRQVHDRPDYSAAVLNAELILDDAFLKQAQLYFYTSGSTGQPKKIPRSLKQLLNEVQGLNQSFTPEDRAVMIATVSHQHIYGLLFKLLWPLAQGHCFYLPQMAYPEDVVFSQKRLAAAGFANYLISSPALYKRWTADVVLAHCLGAYSSGGKLESGLRPKINVAITEILGSSETGGIAYRHADDALWQAFANVEIQITDQQLAVRSQHACSADWIVTGDRAEAVVAAQTQYAFHLLGRNDRIVKLEEKRISLDATEQQILQLDQVEQCYVLIHSQGRRELLVCVAVLTAAAKLQLQQQSKQQFVRQLKRDLTAKIESIAIPRQWRFLSELPLNAQAKLNRNVMQALFQDMDRPVVLAQHQDGESAEFKLEFPPELQAFKGHFPDRPIYPGVGQIGFIQAFAKQCWPDLCWCDALEQIKFQHLIQPYAVIKLKLNRKLHKVSFQLDDATQTLASGRLSFAV